MVSPKTVIVIAGPTAVGKTAVGIELANHFGTEIISADSRQCYKEMSIGVARPSTEELSEVPHHFIASHSIFDNVNAVTFEEYAFAKAKQLFEKKDVVIMVGGTGLYIKAFCEGLDAIPEIPEAIRLRITEDYKQNGLAWLQETIRQKDPLFYEVGETSNPQRLMRALEVLEATSQSILEFQKGEKAARDFSVLKIGLELPRPILYDRINKRVDVMLQAGLLEEVASLQEYQHLNALQTVGYKEFFEHLKGLKSLEEAVTQIKSNTRHYAKRQLTWFKKDAAYQWFESSQVDKIKEHLASALAK